MFACVLPGRPLLPSSSLTQIDATHAYFPLAQASSINHITLFLTGETAFPPGYGATVHFFWPGKGFRLLGMLSNEKPSAVFRVRGTGTVGGGAGAGGVGVGVGGGGAFVGQQYGSGVAQGVFGGVHQGSSGMGTMGGSEDVTAILGLAIEPLDLIASQIASTTPSSSSSSPSSIPSSTGAPPPTTSSSSTALVRQPTPGDAAQLAERIVKHLFNYISGFSGDSGNDVLVPMGTIVRWYENFIGKIKATGGIAFLDNVE